ncbi:MAG: signal recognition particle-docking protein FtsY [Deltaproteobacteria bacterium]|nr:signal recognition particle-docking protein FtsY [Deltaproteobacteria bacterium]
MSSWAHALSTSPPEAILAANAAAIVMAIVVAALVLLMVLAIRKKRGGVDELEDDDEPRAGGKKGKGGKALPAAPASKEVFAPAKPDTRKSETKRTEAAPAPQAAEAPKKAAPAPEKKVEAAKPAPAAPVPAPAAPVPAPAKPAEAPAKAKAEAKKEEPKVVEPPAAPEAPAVVAEPEEPAKTLRDGLGRTRKEGFIARLGSLFAGKAIDQDVVDEVEEVLFTADIGVRTAERLLSAVRESLSKKELKDADRVWGVLHDEAAAILKGAADNDRVTAPKPGEPMVTMVLGVNGTGKTTSIGKRAHQLIGEGKTVALIAGDTFRAAAAEQLEHWGRRVGAQVFRGKEGADPASVVFDGVRSAVEAGVDHVLVDTAGRLHTQVNLMEELRKVRRVMGTAIEGAPHEVLMVLDATTGQNAINQAKLFKDATDVTGIVLTKLDGTAKGGVVLGVCDELKIPIKFIGIGERVADLRVFDSSEFVDELFRPSAG